jgi:hypothetical protein
MLIAQTDVGMLRYFFTGYLNIIIILLCVASVAYSIYGEIAMYAKSRAAVGGTA